MLVLYQMMSFLFLLLNPPKTQPVHFYFKCSTIKVIHNLLFFFLRKQWTNWKYFFLVFNVKPQMLLFVNNFYWTWKIPLNENRKERNGNSKEVNSICWYIILKHVMIYDLFLSPNYVNVICCVRVEVFFIVLHNVNGFIAAKTLLIIQ